MPSRSHRSSRYEPEFHSDPFVTRVQYNRFVDHVCLLLAAALLPVFALYGAVLLSNWGFHLLRRQAYRRRAGLDRDFARECSERVRALGPSTVEDRRLLLRSLSLEREDREAAREREALRLSDQPAAVRHRALARERRDRAWRGWMEELVGAPALLPGVPGRSGSPIRKLCNLSLKAPPTADEVREQYERARGRGRVEEKLRLGSMLLDAEATVDSSLVRDDTGEIVGRNGGMRGWIERNCPELLRHYAALMGYRRLAAELRLAHGVDDPVPASLLLGEEPQTEAKAPPAARVRLPALRATVHASLEGPDAATVKAYLAALHALRPWIRRPPDTRRRRA